MSTDETNIRTELEHLHLAAWGWALLCCRRNRLVAEDVLQTVYLKVLDGKARFEGRASLKTWLFAVIRKTAAEERRWRALREIRFRPLHTSDEPESDESVDGPLQVFEHQEMFRRALAALPRRQQEVLHLVFYQELTIEEAAAVMGISSGTGRTHYERGKTKIRRELEAMEEFNELRNSRAPSDKPVPAPSARG